MATVKTIDGEKCSYEWYVFLSTARKAGVQFHANELRRDIARQQYFWHCGPNGCCCCNNCNLAARPSPWAPHIRVGRIDHAIDCDNLQGLIDYGRKHGVTIRRTVAGESWHGEASAADLRRFAKAHSKPPNPYAKLSKTEQKLIHKLFHHRKQMTKYDGAKSKAGKRAYNLNLKWARYYKARLTRQANLLYKLGKRQGWSKLDRGFRQKTIRDIVDNGKRTS